MPFLFRIALLVRLLALNTSGISQDYLQVQGKVIDAEAGFPLKFANISVAGNLAGTISNQNGEFSIKLPAELIYEKLIVSYLGYKSEKIDITNVIGKFLVVKLSIAPVVLSPVNIHYKKPQQIIREALQNVSKNYLSKPAKLTAFYREETCENQEPIQYIEAVLEVYKGAYNNDNDCDRVRLIKGRETPGLKKSVFFEYLYFVNGPYEVLHLDIAKYANSFIEVVQTNINFLNSKHFKYYDYQIVESNSDVGSFYILKFRPKKKKALFEGHLIIEKESLAIKAMEYSLSPDRISTACLIQSEHESFLNKQGFYTEAVDFRCNVFFKKFEGKYIISNSKMEYQFSFIDYQNQNTLNISNTIYFVVTSLETENVVCFKQKHSLWKNVGLSKQLGKYDSAFWENYNIIKHVNFDSGLDENIFE